MPDGPTVNTIYSAMDSATSNVRNIAAGDVWRQSSVDGAAGSRWEQPTTGIAECSSTRIIWRSSTYARTGDGRFTVANLTNEEHDAARRKCCESHDANANSATTVWRERKHV